MERINKLLQKMVVAALIVSCAVNLQTVAAILVVLNKGYAATKPTNYLLGSMLKTKESEINRD